MPKFPDSLSWSQEPGRVDIIWAQLPGPQQGAWKLREAWPEPELSKHSGSLLQGCDSEPEQGGQSLRVGKPPKFRCPYLDLAGPDHDLGSCVPVGW